MSLWDAFINAVGAFTRNPRISVSVPLPTFWKGETVRKDVFVLWDCIAIPLCRPEFQPKGGVTHCNQYVAEVCEAYGYRGLNGLLANQIADVLAASPQWSIVPIEKCQEMANRGSLIIAALKDQPHGHVNVICPGRIKTSGRWGEVPSCANVGKEVFIGKGINWAFSDMPKFYAWRPTL